MANIASLSELQDEIRARYGELSKRLQQVAAFVLDNKNSVARITSYNVCYTKLLRVTAAKAISSSPCKVSSRIVKGGMK